MPSKDPDKLRLYERRPHLNDSEYAALRTRLIRMVIDGRLG